MVIPYSSCPTPSQVKGRQRRLLNEWLEIQDTIATRRDIRVEVEQTNTERLPTAYKVT